MKHLVFKINIWMIKHYNKPTVAENFSSYECSLLQFRWHRLWWRMRKKILHFRGEKSLNCLIISKTYRVHFIRRKLYKIEFWIAISWKYEFILWSLGQVVCLGEKNCQKFIYNFEYNSFLFEFINFTRWHKWEFFLSEI